MSWISALLPIQTLMWELPNICLLSKLTFWVICLNKIATAFKEHFDKIMRTTCISASIWKMAKTRYWNSSFAWMKEWGPVIRLYSKLLTRSLALNFSRSPDMRTNPVAFGSAPRAVSWYSLLVSLLLQWFMKCFSFQVKHRGPRGSFLLLQSDSTYMHTYTVRHGS